MLKDEWSLATMVAYIFYCNEETPKSHGIMFPIPSATAGRYPLLDAPQC